MKLFEELFRCERKVAHQKYVMKNNLAKKESASPESQK